VTAPPMLVLEDVDAGYGPLQILHGVALRVEPGEIVSLVGANGAGKTTVIKTVVGLVRPRRGRVMLRGERIDGLPPERIVTRGIAVVPEGARVFPEMSVLDNLRMGAAVPRALAREPATLEDVFALFPRLRERRAQLARTLSGGERQMLVIGRALMARPRVLLLDEPSLGLAPRLVAQIMSVLRDLSERTGLTVLLVEQNVRSALSIADQGVVMSLGRVVAAGEAERLAADAALRHAYLGF
jgi:branched-chain amino acid transport system ATP-binding protein